jgi:hypothetical protein
MMPNEIATRGMDDSEDIEEAYIPTATGLSRSRKA